MKNAQFKREHQLRVYEPEKRVDKSWLHAKSTMTAAIIKAEDVTLDAVPDTLELEEADYDQSKPN